MLPSLFLFFWTTAMIIAVTVGFLIRLAHVERRFSALERHVASWGEGRAAIASSDWPRPLAGLRVALDLRQDHPNAPFAALLRERLLREDVLLEGEWTVAISGEIACNGYADVYYRADLAVHVGGDLLFALTEKPPHGDRPENLALELVERLKAEWAKRERQSAIRELGGG